MDRLHRCACLNGPTSLNFLGLPLVASQRDGVTVRAFQVGVRL